MTRAIFKSAFWFSRAIRAGALLDERGSVIDIVSAKVLAHGQLTVCVGGTGGKQDVAGECEFRVEEQSALELPRIGAGSFGQAQNAQHGG